MTIRTADISSGANPRLPGGFAAQLGPFAIVGMAWVLLASQWDRIPETFPVHFDLHGNANGWATKANPASLYLSFFIGGIVCASIAGMSLAILHGSPIAGAYDENRRRTILKSVLAAEYITAATTSWVGVAMPLLPSFTFIVEVVTLAIVFGGLCATFWMVRSNGLSWSRENSDRTPDAAWRLGGTTYFDPSDPALFVEKRFGIGYTLNFGNRWAWPTLALMVGLPLAIAFIAVFFGHRR